MNHPAGRIGKRLILRVRDVMLTGSSLPLIGPDVLIMEVKIVPCQVAILNGSISRVFSAQCAGQPTSRQQMYGRGGRLDSRA